MPTFKQKKSGDYYIHAPGDQNPVNTFQVVGHGKRIIKEAGIDIGEYLSWNLLFLLDDLSYLSTKGDGEEGETIGNRSQIEKTNPQELSVRERVAVLDKVVQDRGPEVLCGGIAADWFVSLLDENEEVSGPLADRIATLAGFSSKTVRAWDWHPLLVAFTLYLHYRWLRDEATFKIRDSTQDSVKEREIVDASENVVYLKVSYEDVHEINRCPQPDDLPEKLEERIASIWVEQGAGIFVAFHSKEVRKRGSKIDEGLVLPRERIDDYPVSPPPRTELSDLYEALLQFKSAVDRILTAEETDVHHGSDSHCERWHAELENYLFGTRDSTEDEEIPALGAQQRHRASTSITSYRDFYGDGDAITNFEEIKVEQVDDEAGVLLYGLGVFETGEHIFAPVAPESDQPLPLYPKSEAELERGRELLEEFPDYPKAE